MDEFKEYKMWIEKTLERFENVLIEIRKDVADIKNDITMLKIKAGVWGIIGSAIFVCMGLAIFLIKSLI